MRLLDDSNPTAFTGILCLLLEYIEDIVTLPGIVALPTATA